MPSNDRASCRDQVHHRRLDLQSTRVNSTSRLSGTFASLSCATSQGTEMVADMNGAASVTTHSSSSTTMNFIPYQVLSCNRRTGHRALRNDHNAIYGGEMDRCRPTSIVRYARESVEFHGCSRKNTGTLEAARSNCSGTASALIRILPVQRVDRCR